MKDNLILHVISFICIALLAVLYGRTKLEYNKTMCYMHYVQERIAEDEATMAGQGRLIQQNIRDLARLGAYDYE